MTTPALGSGRPNAPVSAARRPLPGRSRLLLTLLLACAGAPAFAQDAAPRDPLDDAPLLTAAADATARGPLAMPGRSLSYLADARTIFEAMSVTAGAPANPVFSVAGEGRIKTMLRRALTLLGTPYRWGGTTPEGGFDCSGLVGYVFRNSLGIELPRVSRDMANVGELIRDRDALVEGDLVFFSRRGKHVDHVGIYLGEGRFVHAPRTGKDVEVANLAAGYWSHKFFQARRVAAQ